MKPAFLRALSKKSPGLTQKEIIERVKPYLSEEVFPGGATAGWWAKTMQLDLEAKEQVVRELMKPPRRQQAWDVLTQGVRMKAI